MIFLLLNVISVRTVVHKQMISTFYTRRNNKLFGRAWEIRETVLA